MSGGFRVSIPSNVRKTIQNIKEIAGNHSDEEVYAMLKECSMDPNETAQRLLLQDTFHEVKRKRDKRKENIRDPADSRWRPGVQGRGGRSCRGNYSSRYASNDIVGGRNVASGKENGVNQGADRGNKSSSSAYPDTENKSSISISSSIHGLANGPSNVDHHILSQGYSSQVSGVSQIASNEECFAPENNKTGNTSLISNDVKTGSASGQSVLGSVQSVPFKAGPVSGVYASLSDPVLVPYLDTRNPGEVGVIKRVVGSQRTATEMTNKAVSCDISGPLLLSVGEKGSSDVNHSLPHGKVQSRSQGSEVSQLLDTSHAGSSSPSGPMGSRSSSTNSSRSQQLTGLQKVANKEWKPKSTHTNPAQASRIPGTSDVSAVVEAVSESLPVSGTVSENATSEMEKKLDGLQLSDRQHVIIPNHLQVPESERHGLSFGSFDSTFNLSMGFANGPASEKSTTPPSDSSQEIDESVEDPSSSHIASAAFEKVDYPDHPPSPTQMTEHFSSREADISSSVPAAPEGDQSEEEAAFAPVGPQYSVVHTAPSYSAFGLVPPMIGSQLAPFESSESQARDTTRFPSFMQPFDPSSNYYTQFYRPTADAEGRFSPFLAPGATKYNGNIAVLPAQSGQALQESGNSMVLSTAGSTSLATQAVGVMQGSVAVQQQPVPIFRQPAGVHLSHYPPNYIPYNQYFPPFYVPTPALHHFLSNAAFPQQPPTGNIYPPPGAAAAAATPVKYISQYKPGTNTGNSTLVGMPTGYGTYSSSPAGYTPAASTGNSTGNEDLTASQFKENNVYMPGQQTEGSAVWIPAAAGRDISSLQANSFYSLPPLGQHMAFASTQTGHGAFSGLYHPTPTMAAAAVHPLLQQSQTVAAAVEMVGPPSGVYQQPQRAQANWTNNY